MCYNNFKKNIWPLLSGVLERRYKIQLIYLWCCLKSSQNGQNSDQTSRNPRKKGKANDSRQSQTNIQPIKLCSTGHVMPIGIFLLICQRIYKKVYGLSLSQMLKKSCIIYLAEKEKQEMNAQMQLYTDLKMSVYYFPSCINIIYNLVMWIVFVSPPGSLLLVIICCWLSHAVAIATSS